MSKILSAFFIFKRRYDNLREHILKNPTKPQVSISHNKKWSFPFQKDLLVLCVILSELYDKLCKNKDYIIDFFWNKN